jgi:hypothetical protein
MGLRPVWMMPNSILVELRAWDVYTLVSLARAAGRVHSHDHRCHVQNADSLSVHDSVETKHSLQCDWWGNMDAGVPRLVDSCQLPVDGMCAMLRCIRVAICTSKL